jgi:hypothetical protein
MQSISVSLEVEVALPQEDPTRLDQLSNLAYRGTPLRQYPFSRFSRETEKYGPLDT